MADGAESKPDLQLELIVKDQQGDECLTVDPYPHSHTSSAFATASDPRQHDFLSMLGAGARPM